MNQASQLRADRFEISDVDARMIDAARTLLRKAIISRKARNGQLNSITRLLGALDRLPNLSVAENISVTIWTQLRSDARRPVYQYWEISQVGHGFEIASGHAYSRQGGDAFTMLTWDIAPGRPANLAVNRNDGQLPPSARHFTGAAEAIDLAKSEYELQVDDDCEEVGEYCLLEPIPRARNVLPLHP